MTNLEKFLNILDQLEKETNNSQKRIIFETLCKKVLETAPFFNKEVKQVWKWNQFPGKDNQSNTEIDLVVQDNNDQYWAIQCKFYHPNNTINKRDIDNFVAASSTEFIIDGMTNKFSQKYLFTTTDHISTNIEEMIAIFGPQKMANIGIDWTKFDLNEFNEYSELEVIEKKRLTDRQIQAVNNAISSFQNHDRWKLHMEYGTNRNFTALKIVEKLYNQNHESNQVFNILYLVPSFFLLSQTIFEWKNQTDFNDLKVFGICSDFSVSDEDANQKNHYQSDDHLFQMPIPMTSDLEVIVEQYNNSSRKVNIFFATYQSINIIIDLVKKYNISFEIAVCEEAHLYLDKYLIDEYISTNIFRSVKKWLDLTMWSINNIK
ncbi:Putative DEAD/DEAH box helicase [[Mycoplasma] cavipharyngis]|uniref:restriction endonuclease n=1 Tax=[Mycoplasma] cavipharyngis TaxID=92757 RepID=UPI003703D38A